MAPHPPPALRHWWTRSWSPWTQTLKEYSLTLGGVVVPVCLTLVQPEAGRVLCDGLRLVHVFTDPCVFARLGVCVRERLVCYSFLISPAPLVTVCSQSVGKPTHLPCSPQA